MRISDWSSDVCSSDLIASLLDACLSTRAERRVTLRAISLFRSSVDMSRNRLTDQRFAGQRFFARDSGGVDNLVEPVGDMVHPDVAQHRTVGGAMDDVAGAAAPDTRPQRVAPSGGGWKS